MFPPRTAARLLQNFFIHADCNSIKKLRIKNLVKISFRRFFHFYQTFLQKKWLLQIENFLSVFWGLKEIKNVLKLFQIRNMNC